MSNDSKPNIKPETKEFAAVTRPIKLESRVLKAIVVVHPEQPASEEQPSLSAPKDEVKAKPGAQADDEAAYQRVLEEARKLPVHHQKDLLASLLQALMKDEA